MKIERAHELLMPVLLGWRESTKLERRIIEDVVRRCPTHKARMRLSGPNYDCYLEIFAYKQRMSMPKLVRKRRAAEAAYIAGALEILFRLYDDVAAVSPPTRESSPSEVGDE